MSAPGPTIALAADTGTGAGADSDGITSNGVVNVTLASDFDPSRDTWDYSTDGSAPGTAGSNPASGTDASFDLGAAGLGLADGIYQIRVHQTIDSAVSLIASLAVTLDTTAPTVDSFPDLGEPTVGQPANVKITFSEAVADFASADITSATAIAIAVDGSGDPTTYTVTYTPSAPGAVTLTLAADSVSDLAGNTAPATDKTASGTAQAAATETVAKPRITATITLPGLTTAEFNRGDFIAGMATFLSVEAANVHILRVTAGSVFVYYEIVADTAAALDTPAMTLSTATAAQLRTASGQSIPATSAVSNTVVRQDADEPTAPVIDTANVAVNHAENTPITTAVATYTTDDTNTVEWSHAGTDADLFLIDPASGALTFKALPDYEIPTDAGGDRVYDLTITATETNGDPSNLASDALAVTVTVANVDEEGAITAITGNAQVGQELTAGTVTDLDSPASGTAVTSITHQWQSAVDSADAAAVDDAAWPPISGATGATYEPVVGDVGKIIRVVATYTDGEGGGKKVASASTASATLSADSTLSALEVSAGTLNPAFASGIDAYAVSLGTGVANITVTPTATDTTGAVVTVDGVAVTSGEPSAAIDLNVGNTPISIIVTAEDTSVTQTYTVTVTRAAPRPSIALAADTDADTSDGITSNGVVNVALASGFDLIRDTWEYSTDGSVPSTAGTNPVSGTDASFTLDEGVYEADDVQVRQTVNSVVSEVASLGVVTIDTIKPVIALEGGPVTVDHGGTYTEADDAGISGAGSDDTTATTTTGPDSMIVAGVAVDTNTAGDYTITYTATDPAGNVSNSLTRIVTVSAPTTDTTPPTVATFDDPAAGVIDTEQTHTITFSEAVTGLEVGDFSVSRNLVASGDLTVNSVTPASGAHTTYTISITPRATAFILTLATDSVMDTATTPNMGPASAASAVGTATPALVFAAGGSPALTSSNADAQRAKEGDTLTLAFEVNQELASVPTVTIAGRDAAVVKGAGDNNYEYTATYTVAETDTGVTDGAVAYTIAEMVAADNSANTLAETDRTTDILIDLTAPVIALNLDAEGNTDITLEVGDTYNELGAMATDNVDATDPTPTPSGMVDINTPGDYIITYTATDRAGNEATLTRTVTVREPVAVDTLALPALVDQSYTVGTPITDLVLPEATGGTGTLTYARTGALQAGLTYTAASRTLSGTPTVAATTTLTYTVTDSAAPAVTAMQTFTVIVNAALVLTTAGDQSYTVNTEITELTLPEATGGTAPLAYTLTGDLPTGLTFDTGTRTLFGTPSTAASATELTYTVTDANDASASQTFNVAVAAAADTTPPMITFNRFEPTGGMVDGTTTYLNVDDTLTVFVNSTELLADASLTDAAVFDIDGDKSAQNLVQVGATNQYSATYTITSTDNDTTPVFKVSGVTDTAGTPNTADDFTTDLGTVIIDTTAPTVDFNINNLADGVVNVLQNHDITFSEAVTGLATTGFSSSQDAAVAFVSGSDSGYTLSITPGDISYILILAADAVTDLAGNPNAEARVTISDKVNRLPAAHAGADQSDAVTGTQVTLDGSGSIDDDSINDLTYSWAHTSTDGSMPGTSVTITEDGTDADDPATPAAVFTPTVEGVYIFTLTVTDKFSTPANATDTVTITVSPARSTDATLSGLTIAEGGNDVPLDQTFASGTLTGYTASVANNVDSITVTLTTTDSAARVEVVVEGAQVAAGTGGVTANVTLDRLGTFGIDIEVTAEDTTTNQTYILAVTRAENIAPTADAGQAQIDAVPGTFVTLDGSASNDPDGDNAALTYAWTHTLTDDVATTPATVISLTGDDTVAPAFTPTTAGVYTFALTVTDAGTPPAPSTNDATVVITAMGEDVTLPATPTIALATDTGTDSDGVTSNGVVNVTGLATGATWKYIINGTPSVVFDSTTTTTFTLDEGVYAVDEVQVVQIVNGVDSAPATFARQITVDITAPTVATFDIIDVQGTVGTAQTHPITFSEAVTGLDATDFTVSSLIAPPDGDIVVNSVADSGDQTTYTITFTPAVPTVAFSLTLPINSVADIAGNTGPAMVAMVTGSAVAPASTDATLSGLTIAEGGNDVPLDQAFVSGTLTGYTATVANGVASVTVTPTTNDGGATVTVKGDAVASGQASEAITLDPGVATDIPIVVTAEDASTQAYTVAVTRTANTAPRITAGSEAIMHAEDAGTQVATYTATDDEGNTITWSVGGTDANLFTIDAAGELGFNTPPNFEVPTDNGGDRVYDLTIIATDDGTPTMDDTLDVVVTVINVDEPGSIGAITGDAQVGETLTAGTVTDLDSPADGTPVSSITHQWQSAVDSADAAAVDDAAWPPISGATGATYDPVVGDVGKIIRVVATYTDGEGGGKKVASAPTAAVIAASVTLSADATLSALDVSAGTLNPAFASGTLTGYTATVANNVDSIMVTPTVTDTGKATVTVDGVAVTSGEPSAAIDLTLGENPIDIIVTAEDASTQTYTVTLARAVPPPGIALRRDTGVNDVDNADRITRNRDIDVTLASGATWQFSSNTGSGGYTTGSGTSFSLPNGVYVNGQVRVRQTVNGVTSKPAGLDAFTFDADAPTVTLGTIAGAVIDRAGQMHNITFSEDVLGLAATDFSTSTGITVTDVSGSGAAYTITYTATAASFNLRLAEGGVSDIAGNSVALTSKTGTATPHNTAPTINTGNETPSHAENTPIATAVATYTTDDTNAIAWSHAGTDADLFSIDPTSGALTFKASPNYETPGSAATSNTYSVTITATETNGVPSNLASAPLAVTVTVTNVDEPGAISAISGTAQVGQTLTAGAVTDEDSPADGTAVSVTGHEWQSAPDGTAANDPAWAAISGATDATYEPVVGDVDKIIRVVATYTDGHGSDKMLTSAPTDPVVSETAPVVPTIALADDTGAATDDGITMNGQVDVTLATGATAWAYTINGTPTAVPDTSVTFFILPEGVYAVSEVQVVQTVNSVDSAPARLGGAVTVDRTKPVITVDPGAVEVTQGSGTYNDQGVTVDTGETLVTTIADPEGMVVGAVDTDTLGDYTYTYTATDLAGNVSESVTRTVTVSPAKSTDSTLSGLTISPGTLSPAFVANNLPYAVSLGTDVVSIMVTPTVTDTGKATVTVDGVAVTSGEASEAIDLILGNNPILVVVTAEDTSVTQTYTVTVARAVPPPGIALGKDTARDDGTNDGTNMDRITRNRSIVVTLHADFQNDRDAWEWSQDSGNTPYTTGNNIERSFSPGAVQATYQNNVVGARQTVNGVASEFAGLAEFTHDTVKPIISLNDGGTSVTITKGVAYDDPVTADDVFDGTIDPSHIVITGGPVDINTVDDYTLTYNVMDRAGNVADPLTRTVTVSEPVVTALALPAPPNQSYTVGTAVNLILPEAIGGTGALSYTLTGPGDTALPDGLTFTADTRTLSGAPSTAAPTTELTYTVTDSAPTPVSTTQTFMVTVNAAADTTAPVITFNRFEHTDGIVVDTTTYLNVGDTLTVFVGSTELLADASLTDAAVFDIDGDQPAQNLVRVGATNQYSATYTVTSTDNDTTPAFKVSGVTDTADTPNTAGDFTTELGTVIIDTSAPTIDFPNLGEPTVGEPANVKITFSEAVADFDSMDITGATAVDGSSDQTTYLVTYTPSALGTVTLTLAANAVSDLAGNTAPATDKTASGTAQAAATETTTKPRITATITIPGLTIAEFNRGNFIAGMANFLSVDAANVHILRVTVGSVIVDYEIVANTAAALDAPEMTLSGANAAQLRMAIRQSVPDTSEVSTTVARQEADEPPAPATPTLIQGAVTDTTITLSWVAVDNAESYTVTRVVGSGNVDVPITGLTATDENLDADTEYKYTITATNTAGTSDASAEFDARTADAPTVPAAPSLEKGVVTDTTVALSWTAIPGADSYTLTRTLGNNPAVTVLSDTTDLIFTDTGLTPETDYTYSLVAKNTVGPSTASEVIATTLATPTVPAAPSLEKGVVTDTTVALSWGAVTGADSYTLTRTPTGGC